MPNFFFSFSFLSLYNTILKKKKNSFKVVVLGPKLQQKNNKCMWLVVIINLCLGKPIKPLIHG